MPGHHLWAWAEEQQEEKAPPFWKPWTSGRKHSSFRDSLGAKLCPQPQSQKQVLNSQLPRPSLKPPGEKNGDPNREKIASMFKVKAKGVAEIDLGLWLCPSQVELNRERFSWESRVSTPRTGSVSGSNFHHGFPRLRFSQGLIINGCSLLKGFCKGHYWPNCYLTPPVYEPLPCVCVCVYTCDLKDTACITEGRVSLSSISFLILIKSLCSRVEETGALIPGDLFHWILRGLNSHP